MMDSTNRKTRVCVIGAGQAGMAALYYFGKLGNSSPDVTCYERGATWGGQWNCTWRTDTDEHGQRVHTGMYPTMWINGPKETNELPHYTFDKHFGKNVPSYFTAPIMRHYLDGYWKSSDMDLSKNIRFNTLVTSVSYNDDTDDFSVVTRDLDNRKTNQLETFSHVIVASGQYIYPHAPEFKGFATFPGRILHSQQFRGAQDFKGKRVLLIGAHLSAEDIASQSHKYGAKHVIITWRNKPLGFNFPQGIEERPLLEEMDGTLAKFRDGSTAEIDIIVHCTGYNMAFPYMEDRLKLSEQLADVFPANLYKGVVWLGGGNNKLLYMCMQHVPLQMAYTDVQAVWIVRYITGANPINLEDKIQPGLNVDADAVHAYMTTMRKMFYQDDTSQTGIITACRDYFRDIVDDVGHPFKPMELGEIFYHTFAQRAENVLEFRNLQYTSPNTGITAPPLKTKWIDNFEYNIDDYVE